MKHVLSMALTVIFYIASGQNRMGERVLAEIIDHHQNGTVVGVVYDRLERIPVVGEWVGVGMMKVGGCGREYEVEVVE